MQLLTAPQIEAKVRRLAMEIMEHNTEETELYLLGINQRGMELARRLKTAMEELATGQLHLLNLRLNPADPLEGPVEYDFDLASLHQKPLLLVDDVANTGRTLFYAMAPLLDILPKKIEVAVLVDRAHKSFPIEVTYTGLQLSTTIGDHVLVNFHEGGSAVLE